MAEPLTRAQLQSWIAETFGPKKKETKTVKIDTANGVARKVLDIVTAARLEGITGNDIRAQFAANSNPSSTMTRLRRAGHILHANRNVGKGGRKVEVFWVPGFAPEDANARDFVNSAGSNLRKAEKAAKMPADEPLCAQEKAEDEVQSVNWPNTSPFADIYAAVSPVNTGHQFKVSVPPTDPLHPTALLNRITELEEAVKSLTGVVADLQNPKDVAVEPEADPLLIEAREIACERAMYIARGNVADTAAWERALRTVEDIRAGKHDSSAAVDAAYRALKAPRRKG